ncbi:EscU/YscU/HrcU family type III secretion system export apparatus switch protein [Yoonia sp. R2-816]|uniref:EscU/YscU/HrcU family type III secretion system export apparatus switch protein n=1 Tax=Yoonia sp. R2-816 TaxID=3342638 RepID=UPI003726A6A2
MSVLILATQRDYPAGAKWSKYVAGTGAGDGRPNRVLSRSHPRIEYRLTKCGAGLPLSKNGARGCTIGCSGHVLEPLAWLYLVGAMVIFMLAAGIDMIVQRALFLFKQRMTASEVKRERKEQSGTPKVRQERRRRHHTVPSTNGAVAPCDRQIQDTRRHGIIAPKHPRARIARTGTSCHCGVMP